MTKKEKSVLGEIVDLGGKEGITMEVGYQIFDDGEIRYFRRDILKAAHKKYSVEQRSGRPWKVTMIENLE